MRLDGPPRDVEAKGPFRVEARVLRFLIHEANKAMVDESLKSSVPDLDGLEMTMGG